MRRPKSILEIKGNIRIPNGRVDHFLSGIAQEAYPPFVDELTDVNENSLFSQKCDSFPENPGKMIQPKPKRAIKIHLNKPLLTLLVNYSIINIINEFR